MLNENEIKLLNSRQDQLLKFWIALENIRWRFTSAFGLGAAVVLFASKINVDNEIKYISTLLLIVMCIGGLITQIRIFGLLNSIWKKITIIQKLEIGIYKDSKLFSNKLSEFEKDLYYPEPSKIGKHYFTVHMANCIVFNILLGLATQSVFDYLTINNYISIPLCTVFTLLLIYIVHTISKNYAKSLFEQKNKSSDLIIV